MPAIIGLLARFAALTGLGYVTNDVVEIFRNNAAAKASGETEGLQNPVTGAAQNFANRFKTPGFIWVFLAVVLVTVVITVLLMPKTSRRRLLKF